MNGMHHQMNGPSSSDMQGISLSSGSDVIVRNPPSIVPGQGFDMSNIGALMSSMSLETLGLDMSLEEAVTKVRELAKENMKLREDAQQNNQTMKQQYQTLSDWKARWEQEREDVRKRHEQARTVVTNLRKELKKGEETIKELQLEIAQHDESNPQVAHSGKAEMLALDQAKLELEKKCGIYTNQIQILVEELHEIKTSREDQSTEMDKYVRIVHENEQKMSQLLRSNKMLEVEIQSLKKSSSENGKLAQEKRELSAANEKLMADIEILRSQATSTFADMKSGFVHVGGDMGVEVSDSVPFTNTELPLNMDSFKCPLVKCAAKPIHTEYSPNKAVSSGKEGVEFEDDSRFKQDNAMSDLLSQLQEERTKTSNLIAENQRKSHEMEALHNKVHRTEEILAETDYKLKMTGAKKQVEHNREVEDLRMQLAHARQEYERSKKLSASRTSLDSQPSVSGTEEEMKSMRNQVTSLVGELQEANGRLQSMNGLYEKQKERINSMETHMENQKVEMEIQRNKDDDLIETLRVTINNLETQLAGERKDKSSKERTVQKLNQDYGVLVQHYHEATKRAEVLLKQLEQQKQSSSLSIKQKQQYEERIDNLTAQLITAEDSMQERTKKLLEIDQEKTKLQKHLEGMRSEMDMVAVHKAQAEVYQADFTAERDSREKAQGEIVSLKEEITQLNMRSQQLQEEMDHMSQNQIQQMQWRHGAGGGASPYGGRLGGIDGVMGQFPYQREPSDGGRPAEKHGAGTYRGGTGGLNPQQPRGHEPTEQEEHVYECPKCGEQSPDLDTLQLHVLDCIV